MNRSLSCFIYNACINLKETYCLFILGSQSKCVFQINAGTFKPGITHSKTQRNIWMVAGKLTCSLLQQKKSYPDPFCQKLRKQCYLPCILLVHLVIVIIHLH